MTALRSLQTCVPVTEGSVTSFAVWTDSYLWVKLEFLLSVGAKCMESVNTSDLVMALLTPWHYADTFDYRLRRKLVYLRHHQIL